MSTQLETVSPPSRGATDAARIRTRATGEPKRRGRKPAAAPTPVTTSEEREFWGRQVQGFWNNLAEARGYKPIPDSHVAAIGEPAALTATKYLKDAQTEHPEYLLLFVLTPYLMGAIRIEWERWTRARAVLDEGTGAERGGVRDQGNGEKQPRAREAATGDASQPHS